MYRILPENGGNAKQTGLASPTCRKPALSESFKGVKRKRGTRMLLPRGTGREGMGGTGKKNWISGKTTIRLKSGRCRG